MTEDELAAIRERERAATPGPWVCGGPVTAGSIARSVAQGVYSGLSSQIYEIGVQGDPVPPGIAVVNDFFGMVTDIQTPAKNNASFIAHSRTDVPALLRDLDQAHYMIHVMTTDSGAFQAGQETERYAILEEIRPFLRKLRRQRRAVTSYDLETYVLGTRGAVRPHLAPEDARREIDRMREALRRIEDVLMSGEPAESFGSSRIDHAGKIARYALGSHKESP